MAYNYVVQLYGHIPQLADAEFTIKLLTTGGETADQQRDRMKLVTKHLAAMGLSKRSTVEAVIDNIAVKYRGSTQPGAFDDLPEFALPAKVGGKNE